MSVIIRLQNLPWSANALDIRQYFHGLSIPEGGVHIVGGELGDAFIAFSTDEDARQAFMRNNGKIKEVQISLMLSSRTEMQRVIEQARTKSYAVFMQPTPALNPPVAVQPATAQIPLPAAVPNISPASVLNSAFEPKRDKNDKKDRRRSRSKSKDKDRRDRDRKDRRHRSRSKSRDRKSRRRDRSRSRNRSHSKDKDRRRRDDKGKRDDRNISSNRDKKLPEVWANNIKPLEPVIQASPLLAALKFEPANRLLSLVQNDVDDDMNRNGFSSMKMRDNWPPNNQNSFLNRSGNFSMQNNFEPFGLNNRFQRNFNHRNNREAEQDCCVELEPFFGAYGDIRKFFHGKFISNRGIKFINDHDGRRTGITYIQFGDKASKNDALLQHGHLLNGLQVNIRHLDDQTFHEAVDRFIPNKGEDEESQESNFKFRSRNITKYFNQEQPGEEITDFCCLIVDDLPSYCKEQDILHMFALHPLIALILTKRRRGPIAYVKFANHETAKNALEDTAHHVVGDKVVLVKPCKDEDFEELNKQHDVVLNPSKEDENGTDCVCISNLPPNSTDKDIADFFSDIGVIPRKIHLISNNSGFTGQAFCEFESFDDANQALNKHEASLGNSTVSVEAVSRRAMRSAIDKTGQSSGEQSAPKKLEILPPPHVMRGDFGPRRPFMNRNYDNGPMRGMGPRYGPRPRMRFPPHQEGDEVLPGCTVYMKNVPYKAGTSEILKFFSGYTHTSNVSRRYNPNNTPSDEAKIFFFDPDEASRAVEELHKAKIWDRQIFLRQE